jgi:hypothetical protein
MSVTVVLLLVLAVGVAGAAVAWAASSALEEIKREQRREKDAFWAKLGQGRHDAA